MPVSADTLSLLMASGLSGDALLEVVRAIDADHSSVRTQGDATAERKREADRKRIADKRHVARLSRDSVAAGPSFPLERKVSPCTPSKETNPLPSQPSASPQAISGRERDFERFWQVYPHKMGKEAARKAFPKAFAKHPGLTVEILIEGVQRYIRFKPPDIDFCHPATWLNGGRWNDEWSAATASRSPSAPSRGALGSQLAGLGAALARRPDSRLSANYPGGPCSDGPAAPADRGQDQRDWQPTLREVN